MEKLIDFIKKYKWYIFVAVTIFFLFFTPYVIGKIFFGGSSLLLLFQRFFKKNAEINTKEHREKIEELDNKIEKIKEIRENLINDNIKNKEEFEKNKQVITDNFNNRENKKMTDKEIIEFIKSL